MRNYEILLRKTVSDYKSFFKEICWFEIITKLFVIIFFGATTYIYLFLTFMMKNSLAGMLENTYFKWFVIPVMLLPNILFYGLKVYKNTREFILNLVMTFIPLFILVLFVDKDIVSSFKEFNWDYFLFTTLFPVIYLSSVFLTKIGNLFGDQKDVYDECLLIVSTVIGLNYGFNYLVGILLIVSNKKSIIKIADFLFIKLSTYRSKN